MQNRLETADSDILRITFNCISSDNDQYLWEIRADVDSAINLDPQLNNQEIADLIKHLITNTLFLALSSQPNIVHIMQIPHKLISVELALRTYVLTSQLKYLLDSLNELAVQIVDQNDNSMNYILTLPDMIVHNIIFKNFIIYITIKCNPNTCNIMFGCECNEVIYMHPET
ncbi:MAG: hypothetical protein NZZ41_05045 [Candidatus Dojkabacteria bacterium]|nr:hypothetical protein [Candidatus Dojkabacteria bacterium]